MKIRFSSDDNLHLKKALKLHDIIVVVRFAFSDDNNYCPQHFSDACLYKLAA